MKQRNEPILINEAPSAPRAALYMRVSTGRQAEHDLSIPDQRAQLQSWCSRQGYEVVAEFVEAGASATDDRRPVFQQMIERAAMVSMRSDLLSSTATAVSFGRPSSRSFTSVNSPNTASRSFPSRNR
jgi:Resolvase, N terminal domain